MTAIRETLNFIYGRDVGTVLWQSIQMLIATYHKRLPQRDTVLTEQDAMLITYGDQIRSPHEKPLKVLTEFSAAHLAGIITSIHILPFYPWSSDDGFSVMDYRKVDPDLGDWDDIVPLRSRFRLMFDGVINHISAQSAWFQGFLHDEPRYQNFFISVEGTPDLSRTIRPRTFPLLTAFQTTMGEKRIWTTFSADQIDLNFKAPEVLLEILDILLMYVERGADFIRLDAIAYLWKEPGTPCVHLPQTHKVVQLLRAILDEVAPHVQLITETNVPHRENISYFGDGTNEAQLVYNFALPPLTLHSFHTGDARVLSAWAKTLELPSSRTTFFNFLASHDGIGLNPARGIITEEEIDFLVKKTLEHGGLISYKQNSDSTQSPYEMNINYFDALSNSNGNEPISMQVNRFLAAQAIMLSIIGIPGIYFHSLFGSRGWLDGVKQTGHHRTINREKCLRDELEKQLADADSLRYKVFTRYTKLLHARNSCPAFHPHGTQKILDMHEAVFAIERISPSQTDRALCLHNVSAKPIHAEIPVASKSVLYTSAISTGNPVTLEPYQILWIRL